MDFGKVVEDMDEVDNSFRNDSCFIFVNEMYYRVIKLQINKSCKIK